ncbi:MAG TPA: Gfo/Idh/MocA family oxidoreductase [Longimicrobium sp.]|jgi:predicted dehydrogenase
MSEPILVMTRRQFLAAGALACARTAGPGWVRRRLGDAPLGVAVLGLGAWGCNWVDALARPQRGVQLLTLADPRRMALDLGFHRAGAAGGAPVKALDDGGVLSDPNVSIVVVAAGEARNARLARAACEAGKDVLLGGPLAPEPASLLALAGAAEASGRMVQHASGVLSNPRVQRVVGDRGEHARLGTVTRAELRVRTRTAALPLDPAARAAAWLPAWCVHEIAAGLLGLGARGAAELFVAEGAEVDPRSGALAHSLYLSLRFDNQRELALHLVAAPSGRTGAGRTAPPVAEVTLVLHGTAGRAHLHGAGAERPEQRVSATDLLASWENLLDGVRHGDAGRLHAPIHEFAGAYEVLHAARAGVVSYLGSRGSRAAKFL